MVNGDYLVFFLSYPPTSPSPSSYPFFPTQAAAYSASAFIKLTVLPPLSPSKLFFHPLAFCHTSPPNIDLCSALQRNLSVSELRGKKRVRRPESTSFKMQMQHFLISEINNKDNWSIKGQLLGEVNEN